MRVASVVLNAFTHDSRVRKEAETLGVTDHEVTIFALWASGLPKETKAESYSTYRVRLRSRDLPHIVFLAMIETIIQFSWRLIVYKAEVIHAHDLDGLMASFIAAKILRARLIYDSHELDLGRYRPPEYPSWKKSIYRTIEGSLIKRVDRVVVVSSSIAAELADTYTINLPTVIRNCPKLIAVPVGGGLRNWLGISADVEIVLYLGGLMHGRGLYNALHAVARLPGTVFVALGDGPVKQDLLKKADELGIFNRVYLPGYVPNDELLSYARDASVGVHFIENICLNNYYSLPNKLFEYMMVGLPIVASNFPEISKVILSTGSGVLVNPEDVHEISTGIQEILGSLEQQERMSRNARAAAESEFNWELESQKLLEIYAAIEN